MLVKMNGPEGTCLMMVLDQKSIEQLQQGKPVHKFLHSYIPELRTMTGLLLCYSPDVNWVAEQMSEADSKDAFVLAKIVEPSSLRKKKGFWNWLK